MCILLSGSAFLVNLKNSIKKIYTVSNVSAVFALLLLLLSTGLPVDVFRVEDFTAVSTDYAGYIPQEDVLKHVASDHTPKQPWVTPYLQTPEKFSSRFGVLTKVDRADQRTSATRNWFLPSVSEFKWSDFTTADVEIRL